jgi:CRP/FNR family cyclic AMP-dependent transcriptional regulator
VVELDDLKSIILLSHLTDPMLEKLADVSLTAEYKAGDYIFREGEYARYLYAVIDGKVGLELEKTANVPVMMDIIGRGRTFGFSALVDTEQKKYTTHAKAMNDTKLFAWEGTELEMLFYQDYEMGFLFMKRIAKIAKTRLQIRNVQFIDIYS